MQMEIIKPSGDLVGDPMALEADQAYRTHTLTVSFAPRHNIATTNPGDTFSLRGSPHAFNPIRMETELSLQPLESLPSLVLDSGLIFKPSLMLGKAEGLNHGVQPTL